MDRSAIAVEVRDKDLNRLGVIGHEYLDLTITGVFNNVGQWQFKLPYEHPLTAALRMPGSGIIVNGPVDVLMSGPTTEPELAVTPDDIGGTCTFTGVSDDVLLADMLAFPDPTNADATTQSFANDVRTGAAETLMHQYVKANIGSLAPSPRNRGVTVGTDGGRGGSTTRSARFDVLGELVNGLAIAAGLGFRIVQRGSVRRFETFATQDRSATIRLDARNGTLSGQKVSVGAPGVTRVFVAGQGEGVDRMVLAADTAESVAAESAWNRRIEVFVDQRQTNIVDELQQAADELLLDAGGSRISVQAVPIENETMDFGVDWFVGDLVTVVVDYAELQTVVTGFTMKLNSEGLRFGAVLGGLDGVGGGGTGGGASISQRVGSLERNAVTVQPGTTMLYAGATNPVGWINCNGATYQQTRYPELFAAIGTTYGVGGAGTFKVPNLTAVSGLHYIIKT